MHKWAINKKIRLYSRELLCNNTLGIVEFMFAFRQEEISFVSLTKMIVSMNFFCSFHLIQNLIKQIDKESIYTFFIYLFSLLLFDMNGSRKFLDEFIQVSRCLQRIFVIDIASWRNVELALLISSFCIAFEEYL